MTKSRLTLSTLQSYIFRGITWRVDFYRKCCLLKSRAVSVDELKWLLPRKALIVGTGPSLDRLNEIALSNYDSIILINYAINHPAFAAQPESTKLFFYTTDSDRLSQLQEVIAFRKDIPSLYCCIDPSLPKFVQCPSSNNVIVIRSGVPIGYWLKPYITGKLSRLFRNEKSNERLIRRFFARPNQGLPVDSITSAISAILLLARRGANFIDLIGCDFSDGRSSHFSEIGPGNFLSTHVRSRYELVAKIVNSNDCQVRNLSWEHKDTVPSG
jgi:hypothetical protein